MLVGKKGAWPTTEVVSFLEENEDTQSIQLKSYEKRPNIVRNGPTLLSSEDDGKAPPLADFAYIQ